ncbi:MAG: hypothetical protein Ct9H300mP19_14400 [Dehalococcoidia bacterium]|nr:MAG: hypothetical protein Ct9H300mP19_14400 [Dehalococcoidia bacterium]
MTIRLLTIGRGLTLLLRQDGFSMVYVRVERGDVYANPKVQLAEVARKFA